MGRGRHHNVHGHHKRRLALTRGKVASVCLSVCLSICLSVCQSVCLSVNLSVCLLQFICLSNQCASVAEIVCLTEEMMPSD